MALSWEDVVNKEFQLTKFREGYDREEVEDFLDDVVEELKRLTEANARLTSELEECRAGSPAAAPEPAQADPAVADSTPSQAVSVPQPAADSASSAAGMLAMAQRLHDEYVAEGEQRRAQIIAEAESTATTVVLEAEETRSRTLTELETRRKGLEEDVERLRAFETDYRARLTSYIEGQLREITSQERVAPAQGTV